MGTPRYRGWRWIIVVAVMLVGPAAVAQEGVFTVTRTDDPEPDGCRPDDCSLREAVEAANERPGAELVVVPAGVFQVGDLGGTDTSAGRFLGSMRVTGELLLRGAGRERTIVDLSHLPVRETVDEAVVPPAIIAEDALLTMENLTFRAAQESARYGALYAVETEVMLRSVAILDSESELSIGIFNYEDGAPLAIEDSLFSGNLGSAVVVYQGTRSPSEARAVLVRRSVFRDNGYLALDLSTPGEAAGGEDYQVVVEDSSFHRNPVSIAGGARISRSSFGGSAFGALDLRGSEGKPVLLEQVLVESNTAGTRSGGGVNAGTLTVRDSVFRDNEAGVEGGAIAASELEVSESVFMGNSAGRGGAISASYGSARLTNVTLTGNVAREVRSDDGTEPSGEGGALYLGESTTALLTNTTVVGNRGERGALFSRGRLELASSVVADTASLAGAPAPNCVTVQPGRVVSGGFNLADDGSCGLDSTGDRVGDAGLGPLVATGGTFAHLPQPGSPLVDAAGSQCPGVDQRKLSRPRDADRDTVSRCDVGAVEALSGAIGRVAGPDRVATALAVSRGSYGVQQAGVVVLARSDGFADGLSGGPLAAAGRGPLLLTGRDKLDARVEAELERVLPEGGEVTLLGGPAALRVAVEDRVAALGYRPVRVAGPDRYATAVEVARRLGAPGLLLLASGDDFPDALTAGAAAASARAAVLLTAGPRLSPATRTYLYSRPDVERAAVGGPATVADPGAEPLAGRDRYSTSVVVARHFHARPARVGIASGVVFPDALAGASDSAARGGPLLLSSPDRLPAVVADYLAEVATTLDFTLEPVRIYGGANALSLMVEADLDAALQP